jgi:hypothetical protein
MHFFRRKPATQDPDIARNQKLLAMYRTLLAEYLRQGELWDKTETPQLLTNGMFTLRKEILNVKGALRAWNVTHV